MTQIELETLVQRVELHATQFHAGLRNIETALGRTSRSTDVFSRNMTGAFRAPVAAMGVLRNALVSLGVAFSARQVIAYAEAYTIVQNQLRVAGVESQNLAAATEEIFDIATRTRTPVEQMAEVFSRLSTAAAELGISQQEAFRFTELVGQSVAIAGASSAAAAGALTQLAQAMGGTVVQAQEFNSIIDGARPLIVAAARGLDEAGGSVARFRQLVINGQVTAQEFFEAVMRGSAAITEPFERAVVRPSQALQNLRTAIIETIGEMDQASGSTSALAGVINDLAAAIGSDAFQEGAAVFAADLAGGMRDTVVLAQELNAWVGDLTGNFATLADVIRLPAEQFKFMVDQVARLAGATKAPETSLEAIAPPEVVERIRAMQNVPSIDVRGGNRPPPLAAENKVTFADVIGRLNREIELTRQLSLTREGISTILSTERTIKRQLSQEEQRALIAANATADALGKLREVDEDRAQKARDWRTEMAGQIEESRLLAAFGGQETAEYRIQLALLQAKLALAKDLTAEEKVLATAAAQAETRARNAAARRDMELRTRKAESEADPRRAAIGGAFDIIGLPPPQDFIADAIRLENEMQGITIPEETVQRMADAQQQLQLMTETAPELANTLGQIGQTAVFEGLEAAGQKFLELLVDMLFQVLALQLVMKTIGMFTGTPATPGAPGMLTGMGMPFAGPRQHGGPVRRGNAYLVGEAGPEIFVPGTSGQVVPGGNGAAAAGPRVAVTVINNANAKVETRESQDEQGQPRIDILIDEMVANNMRPGTSTSRALRDRFGLQFQTRR